MKSTELIYEIVEDYGISGAIFGNKYKLMKTLKKLVRISKGEAIREKNKKDKDLVNELTSKSELMNLTFNTKQL